MFCLAEEDEASLQMREKEQTSARDLGGLQPAAG